MTDKYFPEGFSLETPRIVIRLFARPVDKKVELIVFDKYSQSNCGNTAYDFYNSSENTGENTSPADMTAAISWNWSDPANTDQALIKNLKFALISYAFEVVKVKQVKLKGDGSFYIQRSEWPGTKEIFFPELL